MNSPKECKCLDKLKGKIMKTGKLPSFCKYRITTACKSYLSYLQSKRRDAYFQISICKEEIFGLFTFQKKDHDILSKKKKLSSNFHAL